MHRLRKSCPFQKINRLIQFLNKEIEKGVRKSADCAEIGDAVWHTPFLLSRIAYSFLLAPRIRFTFCSLNFSRNYTILVKVRPHETFGSERVKKTGGGIELRKREVSEEERARKKRKEIERREKKGERKKNRWAKEKERGEWRKEGERERGNIPVEKRCEERWKKIDLFFFFFELTPSSHEYTQLTESRLSWLGLSETHCFFREM